MKITRIRAYRVELPLHEGSYKWSGGKSVSVFDSTIVAVETDEGVTGYGEVCPLGPFYLPAYAAGARAGIAELGPHLLGEDPRQLAQAEPADGRRPTGPRVRQVGDRHGLLGYPRQGDRPTGLRAAGRPIRRRLRALSRDLAGIARGDGAARGRLSRPGLSPVPAQGRRRSAGRHRAHPRGRGRARAGRRLVADANTGWLMHDALRVVRAVRDVDVYIEQPCRSYDECLTIRRHCDHPFVLDEVIDSLDPLLRGHADRAMDVVNIKISKFGGLTKARQARDLCVSLGIAMTIEDSWGGDITTAAIAHLAHSTPPEFLFTSTDFNSYVTVSTAEGAPQRSEGRMSASLAPGLGIEPIGTCWESRSSWSNDRSSKLSFARSRVIVDEPNEEPCR